METIQEAIMCAKINEGDLEWFMDPYSFTKDELFHLLGECFVMGRVKFNMSKDEFIDNLKP